MRFDQDGGAANELVDVVSESAYCSSTVRSAPLFISSLQRLESLYIQRLSLPLITPSTVPHRYPHNFTQNARRYQEERATQEVPRSVAFSPDLTIRSIC